MQQLTLWGAAEIQGHALLVAEERKLAAHDLAYQAVGISFIPLAIESLGGLIDTTSDTISSISRLLGQRLGISTCESTCHLFQKISLSLWRGNATACVNCTPSLTPSFDGDLIVFFFVFVSVFWFFGFFVLFF